MIKIRDGLTFDDVLLTPKFSMIKTRKAVDLSVKLSKGLSFNNPIIPSNMQTITGEKMALEIFKLGGMAIIHRFMPFEDQLQIVNNVRKLENGLNHIGFSIGVKEKDYGAIDAFAAAGVKIICIDIAHGDSRVCLNMCEYVHKTYPNIFLIAGNVATSDGAERLWIAGADAVRVGIGNGSICSTRIMTGNGVPQLTALVDAAKPKPYVETKLNKQVFIISDGGAKSSGDLVKALCFADLIMTGNLLAGTDETPGDVFSIDGTAYKSYVGSSTHKTDHIEGVAALKETRGKVSDVMTKLCEGIKSGLSYQGCNNLKELKKDPQFIRMTSAGLRESNIHDVVMK